MEYQGPGSAPVLNCWFLCSSRKMTEEELHEQTVTEYHEWKTRGFFWTLCSTSIKNGINLENFARNTKFFLFPLHLQFCQGQAERVLHSAAGLCPSGLSPGFHRSHFSWYLTAAALIPLS